MCSPSSAILPIARTPTAPVLAWSWTFAVSTRSSRHADVVVAGHALAQGAGVDGDVAGARRRLRAEVSCR
jgi:hypothetical protein